jgi:HAD superfamily hydrolase (TIGR01509 family)
MRALVFDYDGLIIDTESPEFESWQKVYEDHGQRLEIQSWVHVIGGAAPMDPGKELEKLLGRELPWQSIQDGRVRHHQQLIQGKTALPGVESLMKAARQQGWKVGVASSSGSAWVEGGLQRLGLMGYVQTIRTRDRVTNLKPHPEPYLSALADLGAEAGQSFAFEDSRTGVSSAKAAGLTVVAVPNSLTRLHDLSHADMVLNSLEEFSLPKGT